MFFWSSVKDGLRDLAFGGLPGIVALASFGVSVLAALLLVGSAIRARRSVGGLRFGRIAALVVGAFLVGAAASALVLRSAHRTILNPQPWGGKLSPIGFAIAEAHAAWLVFALALLVVAVLSFVAALVRGGKRAALGAAVAFLAAMTGGGLIHAYGTPVASAHAGGDRIAHIAEMCAERIEVTNLVRVALLAAAVVGSVLVVWFDRKNQSQTSEAEEEVMLGRGAAVFALGFALFFATRGMAHDARHPLPQRVEREEVCPATKSLEYADTAPVLLAKYPCQKPCDGPEVYIHPDGAFVDGVKVADLDELALVLKNKRALRDQLRSDKEPTSFTVVIAAPDDMPSEDVEPWVATAKRAYGGEILALGLRPGTRISTATVGELNLAPGCCCTPIHLEPGHQPFPSHAKWGQVARASQEGQAFSLSSENP